MATSHSDVSTDTASMVQLIQQYLVELAAYPDALSPWPISPDILEASAVCIPPKEPIWSMLHRAYCILHPSADRIFDADTPVSSTQSGMDSSYSGHSHQPEHIVDERLPRRGRSCSMSARREKKRNRRHSEYSRGSSVEKTPRTDRDIVSVPSDIGDKTPNGSQTLPRLRISKRSGSFVSYLIDAPDIAVSTEPPKPTLPEQCDQVLRVTSARSDELSRIALAYDDSDDGDDEQGPPATMTKIQLPDAAAPGTAVQPSADVALSPGVVRKPGEDENNNDTLGSINQQPKEIRSPQAASSSADSALPPSPDAHPSGRIQPPNAQHQSRIIEAAVRLLRPTGLDDAALYRCADVTCATIIFDRRTVFEEHLRSHGETGPARCAHCWQTLEHASALIDHLHIEHGMHGCFCYFCEHTAATTLLMTQHMVAVHHRSDTVVAIVDAVSQAVNCPMVLLPNSATVSHMQRFGLELLDRARRLDTVAAPTYMRTRAHTATIRLREHMSTGVPEGTASNVQTTTTMSPEHMKTRAPEWTPKWQCYLCQRGFTHRDLVERHVLKAHGQKLRFRCELCGRSYRFKGELHRHFKSHHEGCMMLTREWFGTPGIGIQSEGTDVTSIITI